MGIPVRRSASELQFDEHEPIGPYQIIRRIAPSCYDAETIATGAPVRIELATEADSALIDIRFTRAQAQLRLVDHPLVAQIIDHGVLPNGRPWIASERPVGTALSDVLAQRRLEPRETTALIYSVAQVLAFAHHRQVVHGALRPHHLTLSRGAKVSISGWTWLRTPGIPAFGDPANTSVYNPPEHDGQSPIDGRADVYALGAIAYRALTGVFPDVSRDLLDGNDPLGGAIENMLSLDARDRNSAAAIVADLHEQRAADRAAKRASSISLDTEARIACAEREIEQLRAKRASSPGMIEPARERASSPRIENVARERASSPRIESFTHKRAPSPRIDDLTRSASAPRIENEPDVETSAISAIDLEQRRTRPVATPANGVQRPKRPTPANGLQRAKSPTPANGLERAARPIATPTNGVERPSATRANEAERSTRPIATPPDGIEHPARTTRPMSTAEYRSRDQTPGIERSTRPMSSVEFAAQGLSPVESRVEARADLARGSTPVVNERQFIEIRSALHDAIEEPNTDRMTVAVAADLELTDLSPRSMTMSAIEIDETELLSSVDPTDRTSL